MFKRLLAVSLALGLAAAMLGCSGYTTPTATTPGNPEVLAFIRDSPYCDVLTVRVSVTDIALITPTGGYQSFYTLTGSPDFPVNLSALRDTSTVLAATSNVPAGTYNQATIHLSVGNIVLYDPTQNPPIRTLTVSLANPRPVANIQPPLTLTSNQVIALDIDFDLQHSLQFDSQGNVTGTLNPVFTITPLASTTTSTSNGTATGFGFGQLDDVTGFIQSVATYSANTNFAGDIVFQVLPNLSGLGAGPSLTLNFMKNSLICGPSTASNQPCQVIATSYGSLSEIMLPSYAEVNAYLDPNGNIIADSVDIEDEENIDNNANKLAFLGSVVSVTNDPAGNVTGFNFYVREEVPNDESGVALDSVVSVSLPSSTIYGYTPRPAPNATRSVNFAGLPFGPSAITPGQELVVHGVFAAPPSGTTGLLTSVVPDSIFLKPQAHLGSFTSLIHAESDDETGAFNFTPCCHLFNGQNIIVFTNGQPNSTSGVTSTEFLNVSGLNELAPQGLLQVRGLLFRQPQAIAINGINVPAGSLVMMAQKVHPY